MLKVDVTYDQSRKGRSFRAEELTQQLFEQSMSFSISQGRFQPLASSPMSSENPYKPLHFTALVSSPVIQHCYHLRGCREDGLR